MRGEWEELTDFLRDLLGLSAFLGGPDPGVISLFAVAMLGEAISILERL